MITLILLGIAVVILILSFKKAFSKLNEAKTEWVNQSRFWKLFIIPLLVIIFAIINPIMIQRVDAGHVGVKVNLTGDNRGV